MYLAGSPADILLPASRQTDMNLKLTMLIILLLHYIH